MAYPPPSYGIQPTSPYDERHLIHYNPSPAYFHGFRYPTLSPLAYRQPQNALDGICHAAPSALAYHPLTSQNYWASSHPFYAHQPPFVTNTSVYHSGLQRGYVHGSTVYDLRPKSGRSNIRALGKQPRPAEQVLGKMIVDRSGPTALEQSDSTSSSEY
ncbi:hypothetical protein VI817_007929 [Penicillium citrinum]|nr:hypothetical protein VI817_007929 [Penicillium citrinum]